MTTTVDSSENIPARIPGKIATLGERGPSGDSAGWTRIAELQAECNALAAALGHPDLTHEFRAGSAYPACCLLCTFRADAARHQTPAVVRQRLRAGAE